LWRQERHGSIAFEHLVVARHRDAAVESKVMLTARKSRGTGFDVGSPHSLGIGLTSIRTRSSSHTTSRPLS